MQIQVDGTLITVAATSLAVVLAELIRLSRSRKKEKSNEDRYEELKNQISAEFVSLEGELKGLSKEEILKKVTNDQTDNLRAYIKEQCEKIRSEMGQEDRFWRDRIDNLERNYNNVLNGLDKKLNDMSDSLIELVRNL